MTLTEFYQLAESSISNNPQDRLSRDIKNVIAALPHDVDKMLFDTYAQCFTKEHIPDGILNFKQPKGLYTGKIAALRRKGLRHLKKWFPGSGNGGYSPSDQNDLLQHFSLKYKTSEGILAHQYELYNRTFEQKLNKPRPHIFISLLMTDMRSGTVNAPEKPFYAQWRALSELRKSGRNNKAILPFFALDPRNPAIYEDFLAAFSDTSRRVNLNGQAFLDKAFPFFGVCVQASAGFLPSDPVLMNIFKVCSEKKIPLSTYSYAAASATSEMLNAPADWHPVAEAFPSLKINLCHVGMWKKQGRTQQSLNDIEQMLNMLVGYPNVYTDIASASNWNMQTLSEQLYALKYSAAQRDVFRTKLLFGSHFYLNNDEKNLISTTESLFKYFKPDKPMLNQICVHNPMRFLFD